MTRKLILGAYFFVLLFTSCKKIGLKKENAATIATTTFPTYFNWNNSRSIKLTLNITDIQFGDLKHIICVYDGDPAAGGNILTKGSASLKTAFVTTLSLTKTVSSIYIHKTSPNNSKSIVKVDAGTADLTISLGARVICAAGIMNGSEVINESSLV